MAVIVRRGPSHRVCTIGWNRETDEFTIGQWLKGRICPLQSDISPDGQYWVYHAFDGRGRWDDGEQSHSERRGAWTAIARAPYLKAVEFHRLGWTGLAGGGLFAEGNRVWLNVNVTDSVKRAHGLTVTATSPWLKGVAPWTATGGVFLDKDVFVARLQRDGWKLRAGAEEAVLERPISDDLVLRRSLYVENPGKDASHAVRTELFDQHGVPHPSWSASWADYDGDRLMWVCDGQLFACCQPFHDLTNRCQLYDFRGMEFERLTAPY